MGHEGRHEHFDEDGVLFGVFGFECDLLNFLKGELFSPDVAFEFVLNFDREAFGRSDDME